MRRSIALLVASLVITSPHILASDRAETGWQWIEQGAMIVDVRTPDEFAEGHLDEALNYPLSDIEKHFADIDKDTPVVLYCRSGNRSGIAYQYLKSKGFTRLHNAGGLVEMQQAR